MRTKVFLLESSNFMRKILLILIAAVVVNLACSSSKKDPLKLTHLSNQPLSGGVTDVVGYVDAVTGKEYAILGFGNFGVGSSPATGIYIIDTSDPKRPQVVDTVNTVPGFDVKVWQNYVYTVDGGSVGDGGIVDISDVTNPQVVGTFPTGHNIFITVDGLMVIETQFRPIRIYDLSNSPTLPQLIWTNGNDGHDAAVIGNLLYDFGGYVSTKIFDITDATNPRLLTSINSPQISFYHSGWPTEDGNYLFICDELADLGSRPNDFTVWNISNLDDPVQVGGFADPDATVHNLYVIGQYAYVSYYRAGFRIFDISDPANPEVIREFDTSQATGPGFDGAFGVFPFMPSGNIYVSDTATGLHIFSFAGLEPGQQNNPLAP